MRYDDIIPDEQHTPQDVLDMIFDGTKKFLDNYAEKHPENIVLIATAGWPRSEWLLTITPEELLVVIIGTDYEHEILAQADFIDKKEYAAAMDLLNEFKLDGSKLHKKIINAGYMLHGPKGVHMTRKLYPGGDRFSVRPLEWKFRRYILKLANDILVKRTNLNLKDFIKTYGLPGLKDVGIV